MFTETNTNINVNLPITRHIHVDLVYVINLTCKIMSFNQIRPVHIMVGRKPLFSLFLLYCTFTSEVKDYYYKYYYHLDL